MLGYLIGIPVVVAVALWLWSRTRSYRFAGSSPVPLETLRVEALLHAKSVKAQSPPVSVVWWFGEVSDPS
ncbi:hypothetical protein TNCV_1288211 [Trichonephila clavipes]|nr:hypothetical protein TNCV_1288211 [Trichonephila clavipes]